MKRNLIVLCLLVLGGLMIKQDVKAQYVLDSTQIDTAILLNSIIQPWEIHWGPDDWIWLTEKRGIISRFNPQTGEQSMLLDATEEVLIQGTKGMLGMTLHPNFADTPQLFVVYVYKSDTTYDEERLVRYDYDGTKLFNPQILIDKIPVGSFHSGSRLAISPDRELFMTVADANFPSSAQDLSVLTGSLLRVNLDGSIPEDNPFPGNPIYNWGHRNSQGLCYASNGLLYSSMHGTQIDDELNIMLKGRNYGWPNVEGYCDMPAELQFCADSNVVEPIIAWTPSIATSDIIFYDHPAIPEFQNNIILSTLKQKMVVNIKLNATGDTVLSDTTFFKNEFGRLRDILATPDGAIILASELPSIGLIKLENPNYSPPAEACAVPGNPRTKVFSTTGIQLQWDNVPGATAYEIRGRKVGSSNWTNIIVTGFNKRNVSNLNTNHTYVWQVRAICDTNGVSDYSAIDIFNIGAIISCPAPDTLFETDLTSTSVKLNWSTVINAVEYEIQGKPVAAGNNVSITVDAPQLYFDVSGLNPGKSYQWKVRALCQPANGIIEGPFTPLSIFTTPSSKLNGELDALASQNDHNLLVDVFPNPNNGTFEVRVENDFGANTAIEIYDQIGKLVWSETLTAKNQHSHNSILELSDYPKGIYFIHVMNAYQQAVKKVILQ